MNALIQGSAARHTKLWMRACWREGIVPLLQMHDALDCSVASPELAERVAQLGRDAVTLEVPMQVDLKCGQTWGDAKHTWEELTGAAPTPKQATAKPQPTAPEINGANVHIAVAQTPIELPQDPAGKTTPSLADLIDERLVNGKIRCPFHDDSTPSCHIYSDHFHCFGCGAHGDAIDWLMMVEGLDRDAAIELLANWKGPISQPSKNGDDAHTFANAMRLWEQAQPIAGTPAIQYLADGARSIPVRCRLELRRRRAFILAAPSGLARGTLACLP
jgi:CHC2 zinc finger